MSRPTREDLTIGIITDVHGANHRVAEYRETDHGFDIALGWPVAMVGPGNARVILTQPLAEYLTRPDLRARDIRLPIGRSSITVLRAALGIRWDWDAWWSARADDLRTMTLADFATQHGCSISAASQRRARQS